MLDGLLGSKFSNKCKQACKSVRSRIDTILKKRQAMVRFLRKDVADLLASSLAQHAIQRMDALIVEMNQAWCYDMIDQYCAFLLKQLQSLQKQQECPAEAQEAVSTVIFAAARFPDLPELCDLRQVFIQKYGGQIELFASQEFVERLQNKSFPNEVKLQVMKNIADEFSLAFDARPLARTLSGTPEAADGPRKNYLQPQNEILSPNPDKHSDERRCDWKFRPTDACIAKKQEAKLQQPRDDREYHQNGDGGRSFRRKHEVGSSTGYGEDKSSKILPMETDRGLMRDKHAEDDFGVLTKDGKTFCQSPVAQEGSDTAYASKKTDHNVKSEDKLDIGTVDAPRKGFGLLKSFNGQATSVAPTYAKHAMSLNDRILRAESKDSSSVDCVPCGTGLERPMQEMRPDRPSCIAGERKPMPLPPYVRVNSRIRPTRHDPIPAVSSSKNAVEVMPVNEERPQPTSVRGKYANAHAEEPDEERQRRDLGRKDDTYDTKKNQSHLETRRGAGDIDGFTDYPAPGSHVPGDRRRNDRRRGEGHDRGREDDQETAIDFGKLLNREPNGLRKHRSRTADPYSGSGRDDEERLQHVPSGSRRNRSESVDPYSGDRDDNREEQLRREQSRPRRHSSRAAAEGFKVECDDEEKMMEKLLVHYSKKGLPTEPRKSRQVPVDDPESVRRAGRPHPPERATSLPVERNSATEREAAPSRALSMQPDPQGRHDRRCIVHERLPDYDELASQMRALRSG